MAQLAEQLICNQQVIGSSPIVGLIIVGEDPTIISSPGGIDSEGGFPSGQRGQTVNLLATLSKVRILLRPYYTSSNALCVVVFAQAKRLALHEHG